MKIFILLALISSSVFAQTKLVTIDGTDFSYVGSLIYKHDNAKHGTDHDSNTFKLHVNYAQAIESQPNIMLRGAIKLERENTEQAGPDTTNSVTAIAAGAIVNFEEDTKNSMFAGGMVGLEYQVIDTGAQDESGNNIYVDGVFGKRWSLGEYSAANISYAPTFNLILRRYGGDIRKNLYTSNREIQFNFLKFDIFF